MTTPDTLPAELNELMDRMEGHTTDPDKLRAALPPDMRDCIIVNPKMGWPMFKHPLYFAVPYFGTKFERECLLGSISAKTERISQFISEGNLSALVWMYERPYRLEALMNNHPLVSPDNFYPVMGNVWTDSENIWQGKGMWNALWTRCRNEGKLDLTMEPEDRELLSVVQKQDRVEVFRGARPKVNMRGISWTVDEAKARWFSNRLCKGGRTYRITVNRSDILAAFAGRGESEVVISPETIRMLPAREFTTV